MLDTIPVFPLFITSFEKYFATERIYLNKKLDVTTNC